MHSSRLAHIADYHLYDTLMYRSPKDGYKPGPGLATSLRSLNPTTWELKLRQGVKFHNGEPFNAEAVKFTIDRVLDPATKSVTRGNFTWIKEVKIVDEYTVQILTAKPFPAAPEFLTLAYIVPPKYLKSVGDEEFSRKPVGTGPLQVRGVEEGRAPDRGGQPGLLEGQPQGNAQDQDHRLPDDPRDHDPDRGAAVGRRGHHPERPARPDRRGQGFGQRPDLGHQDPAGELPDAG